MPPAQAATKTSSAKITKWVDGDTVQTSKGTVRLIGMDTPESGERCYTNARSNASRLAPVGSSVKLVKVTGRDNIDRYGRLLRYVQHDGVDVGYKQIVDGYADAAYDSGSYGTHPRRTQYHNADSSYRDKTCGGQSNPPAGKCDPSYAGVCIPPPPPDLNCGDISYRGFRVVGSDPHNFDADGDGVGCES